MNPEKSDKTPTPFFVRKAENLPIVVKTGVRAGAKEHAVKLDEEAVKR